MLKTSLSPRKNLFPPGVLQSWGFDKNTQNLLTWGFMFLGLLNPHKSSLSPGRNLFPHGVLQSEVFVDCSSYLNDSILFLSEK